jgi:hypothetical protein
MAGAMSNNDVPNKAAADGNSTSNAEWSFDGTIQAIWMAYVIYVMVVGRDWNFPNTLLTGAREILSGGTRTQAGWSVIIGVIGVVLFVVLGVIGVIVTRSERRQAANKDHAQLPKIDPEPTHVDVPPAQIQARLVMSAATVPPANIQGLSSAQRAAEKLKKIIADYGQEVIANRTQCKNIFNDRLAAKREANVLLAALEENVPQRLLAHPDTIVTETALGNFADELSQTTGLDEAAARWAVETWATALGARLAASG